MSASVQAPGILHRGRWWTSDEIESTAGAWSAQLIDAGGDHWPAVAVAAPLSADGACAVLAASALDAPVVLLSPHAADWANAVRLSPGMPLVLCPALHDTAAHAEQLGYCVIPISPRSTSMTEAPARAFFRTPGFAVSTSGSTGVPRLAYRPTTSLFAGARARTEALGMTAGDGVISGVPLSSGQGLVQMITASMLAATLGLLDGPDHRAALSMLRTPGFAYWNATPHFADALGRCTLDGPAVAPRCCVLAAPIPDAVFRTFRNRFGVPLRQTYSSTETGTITVDARPPHEVRPGTVGRPVAGVEIVIGERPDAPAPPGEDGRIWVRSRWQMAGYGLPPKLEKPGVQEGWWPTTDVGVIDRDGLLVLRGRLDDCIRTRDSRLVNLATVSEALRTVAGVRMAVAVPMTSPTGRTFGVVVECEGDEAERSLWPKLNAALPDWARPRRMVIVQEWPRLPNGKTDRLACTALLEAEP